MLLYYYCYYYYFGFPLNILYTRHLILALVRQKNNFKRIDLMYDDYTTRCNGVIFSIGLVCYLFRYIFWRIFILIRWPISTQPCIGKHYIYISEPNEQNVEEREWNTSIKTKYNKTKQKSKQNCTCTHSPNTLIVQIKIQHFGVTFDISLHLSFIFPSRFRAQRSFVLN